MIHFISKEIAVSGVVMAVAKTEDFQDAVDITTGRECPDSTNNESENCILGQTTKSSSRVLTQEERDKLGGEVLVSDFKQIKLEKEAQKNWDLFYKRNTTNFFKDRHWTTREFEELKACREVSMCMINLGRLTEEPLIAKMNVKNKCERLDFACVVKLVE